MQSAEWLKIKEIFYQTLDLPETERGKFLASHDEFVRLEVLELLESHNEAENFIAEPAVIEFGLNDDKLISQQIDDYRIIREIGTGGMGKVYLAEREGFEQKFALKLIKRGMDTDAVLQRFVRERQILSRLEHPNIARLLNVGSTKAGLPYFVMEYVEGEPLTKFCESHQFSTNERLEIFQKVCSAVSYAHQNLVVHRDIKPSNILVIADGTPKLLDFGIAKLIDSEDYETTQTQARVLTPEYASPEQINGQPITTATDVYSLGVVLYELLSGTRPFNSTGKSYREIADLVSTQEPMRPSYAWRDTETRRHGDTEKKQAVTASPRRPVAPSELRGDLDNIILKSLRKEPDRRYQSVVEFSEDIRRYLVGLPVTATADSVVYRFSKFVGRNRIGTAVAALILLLSGFAIWQGIVANRERAKAEQRFEQVRKLANIVLFEYHDGIAQLPGATAMREKMVTDSLEFLDSLSAEGFDNVDLQRDIVKAYRKVGNIQGASDTGNTGKTQEALQSYQKAYRLQEQIVEANAANAADRKMLGDLSIELGSAVRNVGDLPAAGKHFQNALKIFANLPESPEKQTALAKTFWNIANLQTAENNLDGSLENYGRAIQIYEKLAVDEPDNSRHLRNLALTNKNIGSVWQLRGEKEKALNHFQKSLTIDAENAAKNPNDVSAGLDLSFTYGTIASVLRDAKNLPGSVENYQKAIEIREKIFNADNKNVFAENALARGYQELGRTYLAMQKFSDAEQFFAKSRQHLQKMTDSDPTNSGKKVYLAENLALSGYANGLNLNLTKADEFYLQSIAIYADLLNSGKLSTLDQRRFASTYLGFGEVLLKNKQSAKALENLNKARELLQDEKVRKDAKGELEELERLLTEAKKR
jgi:eukaryotic-like serine/threonine-protein kinase